MRPRSSRLRTLLQGCHAHMTFEEAVADFPREDMNATAPHVPSTPWQLLEHIRIAQWDILEFKSQKLARLFCRYHMKSVTVLCR